MFLMRHKKRRLKFEKIMPALLPLVPKTATRNSGTKGQNMNWLMNRLAKIQFLQGDLDYNLVRASMVIIYFFFGYQKWFNYEAQGLIPFFTHGPLIFWMYHVFGVQGSSYFLGVSEWLFGALLFAGFWNKKLSVLGSLGSIFTFLATVTIIPFMPDGWAPSAGGFPAMAIGNLPFLMKDVVLLATSVYLLKKDLARALEQDGVRTELIAQTAR